MTYNKMSGGSGLNQIQGKAIVGAFQHAEWFTIAQITKNINSEVVAPVIHFSRLSPALGVGSAILKANLLAEQAYIVEDESLHILHGTLRKGVGKHASLAGVNRLVASVVSVVDGVGKRIVEFGLADVGLEAVDVLQRLAGAECEGVGAIANDFAYVNQAC